MKSARIRRHAAVSGLKLRDNAKTAGIRLPKRLTVDRDEPDFKQWRRDIGAYRQAAGLRGKEAPARKRLPA